LVGGYVDKVFHWDRRSILIRINAPEGRRELLFRDGRWLYMPKERPETPDTPSNLAVHLRKLLNNARVISVEQREFDRIVVMKMSTREASYDIMLEVFGEGNLIIAQSGRILNCIEQKTWKHRDVRIGADYQFPPSRFNPLTSTLDSFKEAVSLSTADTIRTLATAANLGGQYAEECCVRAQIDKGKKAKHLTPEEVQQLYEKMMELLRTVAAGSEPTVYYQGDFAYDASSLPLRQNAHLEAEQFPTFSDALDEYIDARPPEEEEFRDDELERLQRQLEQQQESLERFRIEAQSLSDRANHLYERYNDVVKLLFVLRGASETMNWEQMREFVSKLPFFVSFEPRKEMIVVKIDGHDVPLNYRSSIDENANLLFTQAKEQREKLKGAESAFMETENKVEERKRFGEEQRKTVKAKVKPTKQFWFESYRWFITAQGRLVLGGRDARSNEKVVKKHLDDQDRYAHADVHGAASVIIKNGVAADENEMREVCIFAIANSKAWTAGVGEGSVYWVLPDQVSKTPDAGEFVPRGGFIIRGKRNYIHHLPLQLAIGEITHEGARKVMCSPVETMKALSKKYVVIVPGTMERGRASSMLARSFEVPEEEVARLLPPGNVTVAEWVGLEQVN
ncbi:MAG TPA: ribosome rescue protein RqcH, partial [Methanomassiliicoccales archaeon]|nr:ribosome rescue protein RqcH [Methanomassiliicoccales archaeon]